MASIPGSRQFTSIQEPKKQNQSCLCILFEKNPTKPQLAHIRAHWVWILDPEQDWFESLTNRFKPRPSEAPRNLESS